MSSPKKEVLAVDVLWRAAVAAAAVTFPAGSSSTVEIINSRCGSSGSRSVLDELRAVIYTVVPDSCQESPVLANLGSRRVVIPIDVEHGHLEYCE